MSTFTKISMEALKFGFPDCAAHLRGGKCGFAQAEGANPDERFLFVLNPDGTIDQIVVKFEYTSDDLSHPCGLKLITQLVMAGQLPAHEQLDLIGPAIVEKLALEQQIESVSEAMRLVWAANEPTAIQIFKDVLENLGLLERRHEVKCDAGMMEDGIRIRMMGTYEGDSVSESRVEVAALTALPKLTAILQELVELAVPGVESNMRDMQAAKISFRFEVKYADPVVIDFVAELHEQKTLLHQYRQAQERIDKIRPNIEYVTDDDDVPDEVVEAFGQLVAHALLSYLLRNRDTRN